MNKSDPKKASSDPVGGNTNSPTLPANKTAPAICWCFTLNNYTSEQCDVIQSSIKKYCKVGFFNKEVGQSGTPHLQGYIEFIKKDRPLQKFGIKEIHWAKAKGNKDQNFEYCSKDCCNDPEKMTFCHGFGFKKKLKTISELRPWQKKCEELIDLEFANGDDRSINWICDEDGCAGKTQFCKYMYMKKKQLLVITGGGYKDIACSLKLFMEDENKDINDETIIFFNVPRDSDDSGLISYKALESLKDGLITSTKYESSTLVFNSPSVWVFSNNMPETSKLSKDRWKIYQIKNNDLIEKKNITEKIITFTLK